MKIYKIILNVLNKIKQDKIFVYASHASFYLLISAIPFVTLFMSFIKQLDFVSEHTISNALLNFFPEASASITKTILEDIFYRNSVSIFSFSVISLLWTASRGISALRRGLRFIYKFPTPSYLADILTSILLMFFMIIFIIFSLIFAIFSVSIFSGLFMFIIGFLGLTVMFSLVYFLFSDRKMPLKSSIPGGISAAISWIAFIRIFSFYIEHFANYSYVYGSLTALFLLVLWIYFSTIIFFLGAELNIILFSGFLKNKDKKKNCLN